MGFSPVTALTIHALADTYPPLLYAATSGSLFLVSLNLYTGELYNAT
jgi:hypothetical protein